MDILETLDREGLRLAPDTKRILAFVIDDIIISLIVFLALSPQIAELNNDIEKIKDLISSFFMYIVTLKIVYHSIFTAIYGASIGKIIFKIKIVKVDTLDKPNALDSIIRSTFRVLSEFLFYIPLLIAFGDPFRRAVHDLLVKSIVIDVSIPQDIQD